MQHTITPACVAADHATDRAHDATSARTAPSVAVIERAAAMLRAAGEPGRLMLLDLLGTGARCVTDLAARAGEPMPAVSQRLRVLKGEGLVTARREGKHVFYALADAHVHDLVANVIRHAGETR